MGLAIFVLHRAVTGTTERFMGLLIEQDGGAFPLWLAPVQLMLITIKDVGAMSVDDLIVRLKTEL